MTGAQTTNQPQRLTAEQRAMVAFAMRWEPFGGGDGEIFPLFGIRLSDFYRGLAVLLDSRSGLAVDEIDRHRLRRYCDTKLAASNVRPRLHGRNY